MSRGFFIDILFLKYQFHIHFSGMVFSTLTNQNKLCEFPLQSFRLVILCIANRQFFTEFYGTDHFVPPPGNFPFMKLQLVPFTAFLAFAVLLVEEVFFRKPFALLPLPKGPIFFSSNHTQKLLQCGTQQQERLVLTNLLYTKKILSAYKNTVVFLFHEFLLA